MYKSIFNFIYKAIFSFVLFFLSFSYVKAFQTVGSPNSDVSIYVNCNYSSGCVPLCVYGDEAIIGYYYDNNSFSNSFGWEIAFNAGVSNTSVGTSVKNIKYISDSYIPKTDIYDGILTDNWQDGELYKKLENEFSCPYNFYSDDAMLFGGDEICFANSTGKCETLNDGNTIFSKAINKTYDFTSEYKQIIKQTFDELTLDASDTYKLFLDQNDIDEIKQKTGEELDINDVTELSNSSLDFYSKMDSSFKYDPTTDYKTNIFNNCDYFKTKLDGENLTDNYSRELANSSYISNYFQNVMNPVLQKYSANSNFSYVYNYNNLSKMMIYNDNQNGEVKYKPIVFYDDNTFKDVSEIPVVNAARIALKAASMCNEKHMIEHPEDGNNELINYDANGTINKVKEQYKLSLFKDPKIDFSDKYDCSFLTDVADIISTGYFILEMAGLAILIVLSVLDYAKVFLNDNADELKKANTSFFKRLIIAVILFLLPALINLMLRVFKIEGINSEHPLCVQISNK